MAIKYRLRTLDADDLLTPSVLIPVAVVFVLLVGVGVAVFGILRSRRGAGQLQSWAHAAYSLWTGGEDCGTWQPGRAQQSLTNWYGASAHAPFWNVVQGLRRGQTGNPAWDKVRALDLLRIGTAATYIDAEQCWTECAKIAGELQQQYTGWEQLGQAFEAGMQAWQRSRGVTDPGELGRVQRNLPALRRDIWPRIRFDTPLVVPD